MKQSKIDVGDRLLILGVRQLGQILIICLHLIIINFVCHLQIEASYIKEKYDLLLHCSYIKTEINSLVYCQSSIP